ncbi:MAG: efflux RND transporter periplasmic adaptor subunit [Candidatus Gracilibacteria bacterium]|jgi:HlyD family secretion protein
MSKILNTIRAILQFLKIKWKVALPIGLVLLIIVYAMIPKAAKLDFTVVEAKSGNMSQEVSVTGKVKSSEIIDLTFDKTGKVASINVNVGDKVKAGQVLATLANNDFSAQVRQAGASVEAARGQLMQARATLDYQKANLETIKKGTRDEELQIAQASVDSAMTGLKNAELKAENDLKALRDDINDVLADAFSKADDAVRKQTDGMFSNSETTTPGLTFSVSNSQVKIDTEWQRMLSGNELNDWRVELDALKSNISPSEMVLNQAMIKAKYHLSIVRTFLDNLMLAVSYASDLSSATSVSYKTYITLGRTNVNTAMSSIVGQIQAIDAQKITNQTNISVAQAALTVAQNNLILKKAGYTIDQISAAEAQVKSSEANVYFYGAQLNSAAANYQNVLAQFEKTIIKSPINGIISKKNLEAGEAASAAVPVLSVMSDAKFEIEVDIPDVDIAKIKVENIARITLDAYGDSEIFSAKVISIDPAETVIEGVPTYKVRLAFDKEDERVKSGMTANIDIVTATRENAVYVPQRAVFATNGDKFVKVQDEDGKISDVKVKTGIRDVSGNVEILEGVKTGDKIVIMNN